jgi:LysM repeat protein
MAARSPARFLAPLALLAVVVALYLIVTHASSDSGSSGTSTSEEQPASKPAAKRAHPARKKHHRRYYTIKPGDTPSGIAEETGVPLSTIERLNPDLNPQALAPGTRLKLRP